MILKRFQYALKGLLHVIRAETNFRIQATVAAGAIAAGLVLGITPGDWVALLLASGLVLSAEVSNTAVERLTDLVKPEHHPVAGKIKDVAAGGVLLAAGMAIVVGVIIFWDETAAIFTLA